ncbi:type IV secretion protein Rhs [Neisseria chenwenguii]|uniref:Type IV secretion protein Rhs n=1 Tax=Neisseria chenwenguii TaxID=1853278 RepID=A0A220S328_9NEIS|nr:type IV secretion protein Rhs [Neisseria chenwenguii]ASK27852.1 type IV secretion protein Rhs [Neisseria chenwenguii]ROV56643.1 type IV secretion protein Rhs [Neisseria chenwenguii]
MAEPHKHWRRLTANEIAAAKKIFSDGICYEKVKIYRGFPCLPDLGMAIAPFGHIHFPKQHCPPDFMLADGGYQMWLIHELTHVWQFQNGFQAWFGGFILALCGGYHRQKAYAYPPLADITELGRLNMEQQADLVSHYYAASCLPNSVRTKHLAAFQTALKDFLDNPKQKKLLPKYFRLNFQKQPKR